MVTGGLGFIGSHFIEMLLARGYEVVNVDKRTFAARENLAFENNPHHILIEKDICDLVELPENISHIVNFAAESHVDNSIADPLPFVRSNIVGVHNLLELIRKRDKKNRPVFIQISTDEVYGDIMKGSYKETDRLIPSNPYSASKAAADQLVIGWSRTYELQTRICRSCNNYGYGQTDTKLIPTTFKSAMNNTKVGIHGTGLHKREWIYVEDNCEAIALVMTEGKNGEIYNITSGKEMTNLEVVGHILKAVGKPQDFYKHIKDRPGQDRRYSVSCAKIKKLGWKPKTKFTEFLPLCKKRYEDDINKK